jgi:hypothetical protein
MRDSGPVANSGAIGEPAIAVDKHGTVGVTWYVHRNDGAGDALSRVRAVGDSLTRPDQPGPIRTKTRSVGPSVACGAASVKNPRRRPHLAWHGSWHEMTSIVGCWWCWWGMRWGHSRTHGGVACQGCARFLPGDVVWSSGCCWADCLTAEFLVAACLRRRVGRCPVGAPAGGAACGGAEDERAGLRRAAADHAAAGKPAVVWVCMEDRYVSRLSAGLRRGLECTHSVAPPGRP